MNEGENYPYCRWIIQQERCADLWLRKFLRVRKNLYKDMKQFDPWRNLSRCEKCHVAFWGKTKYCKTHKRYEPSFPHKMNRYKFYYDGQGNKIPV